MNAALRILEAWTTHQDYLWFLALLAWGGVLGGEWHKNRRRDDGEPRYWLMVLAASGMAAALLELVLLAQDIRTPYTGSDLAMGFVQACGTAALVWATATPSGVSPGLTGTGHMSTQVGLRRAVLITVLVVAAAARYWRPTEAGAVMCLVHAFAVAKMLRQSPRQISARAGAMLACTPIVATYGPLAYALDHGRRTTDWSYFSLVAALSLMSAGGVLAAEVWRQRLWRSLPETPAAAAGLRKDLRRAVMFLAAWLAGGVLLAVQYGRHARQAFEENLLRRMETAVLAIDSAVLTDAFSPALRVEGIEQRTYPDGETVEVAMTPRTADAVFATLRGQLARIRERNPDFHLFYIMAWRQGYLLEFASEPRNKEPGYRIVNRRIRPVDLERLAARKSFLVGPQRRRWGPAFTAQTPLLHPQTGSVIAWLVADIEATRWTVTFTQARLQTMALVGAGVGLWALAVAYRLRREGRDAAEQKAAAAAAADRMKSAFLAKVSHELRTPIQSVLGYSELLAGAPLSDTHRAWLNALRSHGDVMLRLVNDLIDLGALQSGAFQLQVSPTRLRGLIDECVAALGPAATARGLALQVEIGPDIPVVVATDGVRLRQILLNLLTNAVKFTPAGRVTLTVLPAVGNQVQFTISDTGPGITPEFRNRLFQPFARLDPTSGGSGLGLALVHGLCAALGGKVELLERSVGATFAVTVPFANRTPMHTDTQIQSGSRSLSGMRVVVAEDNTLVRELLVTFLNASGARVFAAGDGVTALTFVRENSPDVLLVDIGLPGMDGIAVTNELRRTQSTPLRIIGLSAHAGPLEESRARAAGMDEFFSKPVSLARLGETLIQGARPTTAAADRHTFLDAALRSRLATDFASETPRLVAEMHAALADRDWERLRSRAHYLKNSADILGLVELQDACRTLATFDDATRVERVTEFVDSVCGAIPKDVFA
jgi:signal transduction histidine kinase/DNA-binding NarL/FixJ family response regulator